MKIISLNTRVGRMFENLSEFLIAHRDSTDIFCFQEVFHSLEDGATLDGYYKADIYNRISKLLPDHLGFHAPTAVGGFNSIPDFDVEQGNAIFAKRGAGIKETGMRYIFGAYTKESDHAGNMQYMILDHQGTDLLVVHFHGTWTGTGKGDTESRLFQSQQIKDFIASKGLKTILVGDFNLNPDTESLSILKEGMRDLVSEYDIKSTRSKLYRNYGEMHFADYAIISSEIEVKSFEVPYTEASDHLPLILEV